ncbi:hypothetical protein CYMTET_11180 [Cymbomonas tetramitiformis]|uniref:Uncharacterized protein n=1 Tax=Cymbomonas tetramitiformis TaxID=36881 RepID=A0AAE0GN39_9CHLO|nr:hypothetical protein CYMTET_11180 [Cymbomonas tetramitiformis]
MYSKDESGYRLLQFARSIPASYEGEIHFYHVYVLNLFVNMHAFDIRYVAEYDTYLRQIAFELGGKAKGGDAITISEGPEYKGPLLLSVE